MQASRSRLRHLRHLAIPVFFLGGWLFNFMYDIKFASGFLSGWWAHSWFAQFF